MPPHLKNKDKVAIIATAKNFNPKGLEAGIAILKTWGLEVVLSSNLHARHHQFAGTDEQRIADLQEMLDSKEIKAIFCARGGYGTTRIIDKINFKGFKKNPKWVIGYSDVTVLLYQLNKLGFEGIHGPMPLSYGQKGSETSLKALKDTLFGKPLKYKLEPNSLNRNGQASGLLIGGNLSIINNIIGTPSDLDTKGKILFIEDIGENLYHLDRMMVHLKRAGKLKQLSGLIVGHMTDMKDNEVPFGKNANEIVYDAVKEYKYPVCLDFPVGHEPLNLPIICGREAHLMVDSKKVKLIFNT